ncbi:MAG: CDP-alcohol phosphatidyltransferase [Eggerthellaceae bacterium]
MGTKAEEPIEIAYEDLSTYLRANHSAYLVVDDREYYLTDVNEHNWRAQDTSKLNEKGHYVDCSELVPMVEEFLSLPFIDGKTIEEVYDEAQLYPSVKK